MSFEPKDYGVTIEISKEDLLKKYPEGPSPALKDLIDSASVSYKADWFKDDWFAEKKETMSYYGPELKAFERIQKILKDNPYELYNGEFVYFVVKSVFAETYSDIIPDEKMLKAAFDTVQIHIIPELKKEYSKLSVHPEKLKDLQMACSAMAKPFGATATFEPKANQMAFRLTVTLGELNFYGDIPQTALAKPNFEIYDMFEHIIEGGIKKIKDAPATWGGASIPPMNIPLGMVTPSSVVNAGGNLTFSSPGGTTASTFTLSDIVTTSSTPWTGGATPVAPTSKPPKPEKPFSIDDMYAGPKPSWAKKDKAQAKGQKHQSGQQTELDKAFEQLVAEKTKALQDIAKLEAEGKTITQILQVTQQPYKPSTIAKVKNQIDKAMEAMHAETIKYIYGTSKEKK